MFRQRGLVSNIRRVRGPLSPYIVKERWEATGTDDVWDNKIETTGTVDDDYATSNFGSPPWMGAQCMQCAVTVGAGAFRDRDYGSNIPIAHVSFDVVVESQSFSADAQAIVLFDAFDDPAAAAGDRVLRAYLQRATSTTFRFILEDWRDDTQNLAIFSTDYYEEDKPFRLQLKWDKTNNVVSLALDDVIAVDDVAISSARGVRYFRVGVQSPPVSATIVFDNFVIRPDRHDYYPTITKDATTENAVWAERHQATAPGLNMPWSAPEANVGSGNSIDNDAAPSAIAPVPNSWKTQACKVVVGATEGGALNRHNLGNTINTKYFGSVEFYLESDSSANDSDIDLIFLKKEHPPPTEDGVANVEIYKNASGDRNLVMDLASNSISKRSTLGPLEVGRFYKIEQKIDFTNGFYEFWLDGVCRFAGTWLSAWNQEINWIIEGTSGGSDTLNFTIWYCNYLVATEGWATDTAIAPIPILQVVETDLAQAVAKVKAKAFSQVVESDLSQPMAWAPKHRFVAQVTESDISQPLSRLKEKALVQVSEVDLAQPMAWAPKHRFVAQVIETDLAQALTSAKAKTLGQVFETDLAQSMSSAKLKAIGARHGDRPRPGLIATEITHARPGDGDGPCTTHRCGGANHSGWARHRDRPSPGDRVGAQASIGGSGHRDGLGTGIDLRQVEGHRAGSRNRSGAVDLSRKTEGDRAPHGDGYRPGVVEIENSHTRPGDGNRPCPNHLPGRGDNRRNRPRDGDGPRTTDHVGAKAQTRQPQCSSPTSPSRFRSPRRARSAR